MNTILITGASGGIGRATADCLARANHRLVLTGRDHRRLADAASACGQPNAAVPADLTTPEGRRAVVRAAIDADIDTLINNAGTNQLALFGQMEEETIAGMMDTNVIAPLLLTRALLPHLQEREQARIVNVGSTFGTIGFPGYVVYSSGKFALRGFSEALRRELAGSRIIVQYIAPRATRTGLNPERADAMNVELGNTVDDPEDVARAIMRILTRAGGDYYLGWPEKLFARVNAIVPRVVTRALRGRLDTIRQYADDRSRSSAESTNGA